MPLSPMPFRSRWLLFALLGALTPISAARARHYEPEALFDQNENALPNPSGGSYESSNDPLAPHPIPYTGTAGSYGGWTNAIGNAAACRCYGEITTVFAWKRDQIPDPNNPGQMMDDPDDNPPPKVVVSQHCNANWSGWSFGGAPPGACANGLGHDQVLSPVLPQIWIPGNPPIVLAWSAGGISQGSWSEVRVGAQEVTVACEPSANTSSNGGAIMVSVNYSVSVAPAYVSGTNCRYVFHLPEGFTGTFSHITVTVNGNEVLSTGDAGFATHTPTWHYASTHFADNTDLNFLTVVTNTGNNQFKCQDCCVVYNKYSARFLAELEAAQSIAGSVTGSLQAMSQVAVGGTNYVKADFLMDYRRATAGHFSMHGWSTYLGDVNPAPPGPDQVTAAEIGAAVAKRYWRPPINIVFASACSTAAGDATIPGAFGCNGGADRGYVGFDRVGLIGGLQAAGRAFWSTLSGRLCETVEAARQAAQDAYWNTTNHHVCNCVTKGDGAATLIGLYGISPNTPLWSRLE